MIELLPYLPFLLFALLVLGLICAGMAYKMKLLREEIAHLNALVSDKNKRLSLKEVAGSPEYGVLSDDLEIAQAKATLAEFQAALRMRAAVERERPITR